MRGDRTQHDQPEQPDAHAMQHVVQKIRVLVERLGSHEHHQIADQVARQEEDHDDSGHGNNELFPDR